MSAAPNSWDRPEVRELTGAPGRRLELPGLLNLRDVGGYPAGAGGTLRWRTLLRSDALHQLTASGQAELAGLGLRTIVDLRTQFEADDSPTRPAGRPVRRVHISLLQGNLAALPLELDAIYRYLVDDCGAAIAGAVTALGAPDGLPALVHCSAGKDRTGVVIALVLALLGVPDEVIAADYALSAVYLDPDRTPVIGHLAAGAGQDEQVARLLTSPPALILDTLARVRAAGGSVRGYLLGQGARPADLDRLTAALVIPAGVS